MGSGPIPFFTVIEQPGFMNVLRILLLEDSPLDAELTLATLADAEFACETIRVETGDAFRHALGADSFDLILADYALPSFDGISALAIAREMVPEVPFIFVSGTLGEELAIDMLKKGATDYVVKQRLHHLVPAIERALREAEERRELLKTGQALRGSEERFRLLVEGARDYAILLLDTGGQVTSWNSGAERILGYREEEIIGRNFSTFFTAADVADNRPELELGIARTEGRAEDERWHLRKDGGLFWASGVVTPLYDEAGELRGFSKIMRDATERREYELELQRAKEAAEAANRAKDQFLATLSHELRTPLTPVLASLFAIEEQEELLPETRALLEIIRRNVELEARLIDDLLDLTRVSKGKLKLSIQPVDVRALVHHVLENCREDINAKKIHVRVELDAHRHHVHADPSRLQQVIWNLVKNAVKFTPSGGMLSIRSRIVQPGRLEISITDTGIGIESSILPKIFDAFEQGEKTITRRFGGLGLGLAISKAIVDMHGGRLHAASDGADKGSTFTVELALSPADPDEPLDGEAHHQPEQPRSPLRILVIDDHEDTRKVIQMLLERKGYAISVAQSVQTALDVIAREELDLIISDIGLPDGTGIDVVRALAKQGRRIKAIALSGYGMEEDVQRSRDAGFFEHLTKPISIRRLQEVIDLMMDGEKK